LSVVASEIPSKAPKPMDDTALIAAIDDSDERSYGSDLSNLTAGLSAERAINIDLYLGKNLEPAPQGQSNVIDRTVFETIQWILPSLCRIFANGDDVVTLLPDGPQDEAQAKQETAYLNWFVTQRHPWYELFLEWATDCLLTKNFLVYKDNRRTTEIEQYTDQTTAGVSYLLQDASCTLIDASSHPAPDLPPEPVMGSGGQPIIDANGQPMTRPAMLYDCTIRRASDTKDLCIRVLPPERVKIDQRAFSWRLDDRCNYFEYWEETTLTELREQGFDVPDDAADDPEIYTQEDYARDQYGERRLERYKPSDPSLRRVKARMIWIRCDYDGDGIAELLYVVRLGRRILHKEEVSRFPVASGVATPLPHRHIGTCPADETSDIQRIKTAILRQGLDNLYLANNPQKVMDESKVNIDDVLISITGGVIRATDINAIRYEQAPFIFPQAIEGLEYMDTVRQGRTGVSSAFSGIDPKDLNDVAPGTVNQTSTMSAERVIQIARTMACAIEDLFSIIHEQVLKMGHKRETVQLAGQWVEVDPGSWKKRNSFKICVAFASGNKDAQIGRLMMMLQKQTEALEMKLPVVTPENYYNTLVELTKAADFASPERFWTDPSKVPPPPPQPPPEIMKAQMEIQSREKVKAAELVQQEVESQRQAAVTMYGIDAKAGTDIIEKHIDHGHEFEIEHVRARNEGILDAGKVPSADGGLHIPEAGLHDVMGKLDRTAAIASGRKVLRHGPNGDVQGVDVLDHTGATLMSRKVVKDASGRITGLE
jgi:hypothetical protein